MRYYNEGTLRCVLHSDEMMKTWQSCVDSCVQIIGSLADIHCVDIVHRDLHSGNLLRTKANTILKSQTELTDIADFGLSVLATDNISRGRDGKYGVIPYMAPELFLGKPHTKRSDVYAFGCIMYEILAGHPPFIGDNVLDTLQKQINDDPVAIGKARDKDDLPKELEQIVHKTLQKLPEDRFQSMEELLAALEEIQLSKV